MVAYTIYRVNVMYVTFKIALNIQVNVSNKSCLYHFHAGTGLYTSLNKVNLF